MGPQPEIRNPLRGPITFWSPSVTVSSCSFASLPRPPLGIILNRFGGADGRNRFNDTWIYDVSTRKWTELQCTGSIPSPRDSHAATLVDGVMYVCGGRVDGAGVDDLLAFKLSSK
jgi:hypothetical protein